jgi:hypothetical protein
VFGSASAPPFGLRSSRTEHPHHQRPRGWARTNRRSGPSQVAKLSVRTMRRAILAIFISFAANALAQSFQTTVQPQPKEDLAQSCHYELTLVAGKQKVHGVWVIYDRGPQITSFYSDPDVAALAKRNQLALLLAHQCNSINAPGGPEEMDMDPSHGIGRALFTALDQFAQQSNHPELSSSKLVLLGFSGTGALFAHFEEYAPNRVIAAVLVIQRTTNQWRLIVLS